MANCLICWPNIAAEGALSGGSWVSSLPLSNLVDSTLAKVARTTNVAESSTKFALTLPDSSYIRVVSLLRHNLSLSAKLRMSLYYDASGTSLCYTTGIVDAWPSMFDSSTLEWEFNNFWTGTLSEKEIGNFPKQWLKVFDERMLIRRIDFEFFDSSNVIGYLDFGGIFVSLDWQPAQNIVWGSSLGWTDTSEISESWSGVEHFRERAKYRMLTASLDFMEDEEGVNKALLMTADRGITKDVLFVWNPDEPTYLFQRSFLGRLSVLNPLVAANWRTNSMAIQIKERI